jgi:hypothetical protein
MNGRDAYAAMTALATANGRPGAHARTYPDAVRTISAGSDIAVKMVGAKSSREMDMATHRQAEKDRA